MNEVWSSCSPREVLIADEMSRMNSAMIWEDEMIRLPRMLNEISPIYVVYCRRTAEADKVPIHHSPCPES